MKSIVCPRVDWSMLVRSGDRVACSHMTSEPVALLQSLAESGAHDGRFNLFLGVPFSFAAGGFPLGTTFTTFGGMGSAGRLARSHTSHLSVSHYSRSADGFVLGTEAVDVALVSLARAPDGSLHLGAAHGYALEAARRARCVVAEINALAPVVTGAPWPAELEIALSVEVAYPLTEMTDSGISEVERRIAAHVAPLVADGACLQVGIGGLPSAILAGLSGHRGLGIHSGMLTPALWQLVESGAIDNSRKAVDPGISIAGCVFGDAALYAAVHRNPQVGLRPPATTHAAPVIARLERFTALNSALEVDLLGQVNAESVMGRDGSPRHVGGVGGLNDFVRAAQCAAQGISVIALPSRQAAQDGQAARARIVPALSGPATVASSDADVVATEHGVAHLRNATLDERAHRLIAIAHPDDRAALLVAARRSGQIR
jgi:acyl-CoA hydrolase